MSRAIKPRKEDFMGFQSPFHQGFKMPASANPFPAASSAASEFSQGANARQRGLTWGDAIKGR